jgi:GNAT superfamily N-acetyltransferase
MEIQLAESDAQILACHGVMRELRPHIAAEDFVSRVHAQAQQGYQLAFIAAQGAPLAVAGFRLGLNLAWGRYLYVDDLVVQPQRRSCGLGAALLNWLHDHARAQGCTAVHLDSGMQREQAHRFYNREGMTAAGLHFVKPL